MPTTLPMAYSSPKRKRVTYKPNEDGLSASSPSPSVPELKLREEESLGGNSPRNTVASRFGELTLRGDPFSGSAFAEEPTAASVQAAFWDSSHSDSYGMSQALSAGEGVANSSEPSEPPANIQGQSENEVTIAPAPSTPQQSPRKKRAPSGKQSTRARRGSPPLISDEGENPLTWHDSEITGHLLSDPNDDGYGINGVGFRPTTAIAWARSQRRQRQVADWKSREAREARERRREKREGIEQDRMRTVQNGAIQKKVKFDV
ncbi:uncharacterized protein ASPGLDRAFT_123920 [Aspergillus glaucus CBS 516.65]|uniref:Uncharacterized protein n=1 Tax=Aspergillus glaucus CBS 516.65 TaxID=1160497 RepID=A0A1L9VPG9_ASPGL|nr:hypothetical protein ASPGLDRAFT_123920 [Aspergillus glaucus CBS 516.65]OJJ85799.1 hypothetical protein ASPGLDRAFT_123920 [Aspergillus glaucus CBS 516.65]